MYFTIVIEAMGDFVSYDHANAPIVQWLRLLGTEKGWLQNASWEDYKQRRWLKIACSFFFCNDRHWIGCLPAKLLSSMSVSLNCIQKSSVTETNAGHLLFFFFLKDIKMLLFLYILFYLFLVHRQGKRDLISPTRDRTHAPYSERSDS